MNQMHPSDIAIDQAYLKDVLARLLAIPSPSGFTDEVVRRTCRELDDLGITYELTRRGAIRATLPGERADGPRRAVAAHLDTLGAMVKTLNDTGRVGIVPIGHWSARFAEGARVTIHTDDRRYRGTVLPLKASGHTYNEEVDSQPSAWSNLEIRVDESSTSLDHLWELGIRVGDYVSIDPGTEFTDNGFVNSRHIDDKAGVASILAAAKAIKESGRTLPLTCHLLFTISEEVGVGASHVLQGEIAEMVSVDNGTIAPNQNTCEYGVTLAMQDSSGPFDRHLTRHLIRLCQEKLIEYSRDVFLYYRSDSAAALEAGNDIRTALVCFALDASHGWERTHMKSLDCVARLLAAYMGSPELFDRDENVLGPTERYPLINNQMERRK